MEERHQHSQSQKDEFPILRYVIIITIVVVFIFLAFVQFQNRRTANRIVNETKSQLADWDRVYDSKCTDLPKSIYDENESEYTFAQAKERCVEFVLPINRADFREELITSQIQKYFKELEQKGALHKYTNVVFSFLIDNPIKSIDEL